MATFDYHPDALANDFLLFGGDIRQTEGWRELFAKGPPLSAITMKPAEESLDSVNKALAEIVVKRNTVVPSSRLWLFVTHGCWQNDTRIVDYWKMWKYLGRQKIDWPESDRGAEIAIRSPRRVRYATTALVTDATLRNAGHIMFNEFATSFLLMSESDFPSESSVHGLFDASFSMSRDGYHETYADWGRLLKCMAEQGNVIVKRAGLFDEFAWSLDTLRTAGHTESSLIGGQASMVAAHVWRTLSRRDQAQ